MASQRQKTKFVVRKIPSHVQESEIKKHLERFEGKYNYFEYRGQPSVINRTRRNKTNYKRFYINFSKFEDGIDFVQYFKNVEFPIKENEENGEKMKLIVEFAPFQKIVISNKISEDHRMGTITKSKDYMQFVDSLGKKAQELENTWKYVAEHVGSSTSKSSNKTDLGIQPIKTKYLDLQGSQESKVIKIEETTIDNAAPLAKYLAEMTLTNKTSKRKKLTRKELINEEAKRREQRLYEKRIFIKQQKEERRRLKREAQQRRIEKIEEKKKRTRDMAVIHDKRKSGTQWAKKESSKNVENIEKSNNDKHSKNENENEYDYDEYDYEYDYDYNYDDNDNDYYYQSHSHSHSHSRGYSRGNSRGYSSRSRGRSRGRARPPRSRRGSKAHGWKQR